MSTIISDREADDGQDKNRGKAGAIGKTQFSQVVFSHKLKRSPAVAGMATQGAQ